MNRKRYILLERRERYILLERRERYIALLLVPLLIIGLCVFGDNYKGGLSTTAGSSITTGDEGTYVGSYAGFHVTTGYANTMLGQFTGYQTTTGTGNVYLGYMAGYSNTTSNYKLYITTGYYPAYGIFGAFNTGFFGVNTTSPTVAWDVAGALAVSGASTFTGGVIFAGNILGVDSLSVRMSSTSDATDSAFVVTNASGVPKVALLAPDNDEWHFTINLNDQAVFNGAGGGYTFDDEIISIDHIRVSPAIYSDTTDSTYVIGLNSGNPYVKLLATDNDSYTQTINTADQAIFSGATGGWS